MRLITTLFGAMALVLISVNISPMLMVALILGGLCLRYNGEQHG